MKIITVWNVGCWLLLALLFVGCETKNDEQAATQPTESASGGDGLSGQSEQRPKQVLAMHPGKKLHDTNCISCHDATIYQRKERKVRDFMQLAAKVERCDANLEPNLSSVELEQVTEYLNQAYYQYVK